jgi:hypothetical protein
VASQLNRIDFYYASIPEEVGRACDLLQRLAASGSNLLAFAAVPLVRPRRSSRCFRRIRQARRAQAERQLADGLPVMESLRRFLLDRDTAGLWKGTLSSVPCG